MILENNTLDMYVNVSDVASFIGQSKWDIITPFERLWKNNDPDFDSIILENRKVLGVEDTGLTKKQKIEKYIGQESLDIINDKTITSAFKKAKIKKILKEINVPDSTDKEVLESCIESTVNTEYGIRNEEKVIDIINKVNDIKIDRKNKLYIKEFMPGCNLCGRVDGLYDNYIIEVKNRMRGFFKGVRDYENTQVQLYMWMLESTEYVNLEEHYNNKTKTTKIYKDNDYIEYVIEILSIFARQFKNFLNDTTLKKSYLSKSKYEKEIFIKDMIRV